ncbi:MAG: hypothetical protein M0R03_08700 [Novosphingobium sp.]|nr:hypothetical protein [Novosphingobium sp.]
MDDLKLSIRQLGEIKHALGGNIKKPYRNRFNTIKECPSWNELVKIGYATKQDRKELGGVTYYVTDKCINDLKYIL